MYRVLLPALVLLALASTAWAASSLTKENIRYRPAKGDTSPAYRLKIVYPKSFTRYRAVVLPNGWQNLSSTSGASYYLAPCAVVLSSDPSGRQAALYQAKKHPGKPRWISRRTIYLRPTSQSRTPTFIFTLHGGGCIETAPAANQSPSQIKEAGQAAKKTALGSIGSIR